MKLTGLALVLVVLSASVASANGNKSGARRALDFNREVRPILSDKCFHCHGPDPKTREAGLRLDEQKGAFADLGGYKAIVPGQPQKSELYIRVTAKDPDDLMPPHDSGKKLTREEIATLERWIDEGATWSPHWAFIPAVKPAVPPIATSRWARNP